VITVSVPRGLLILEAESACKANKLFPLLLFQGTVDRPLSLGKEFGLIIPRKKLVIS
jgi:hypothetical protein